MSTLLIHPPLRQFYDRSTAAVLAQGASAAYGGEREIGEWALRLGCADYQIVEDAATGLMAFVAQGEDAVVVCFRGTVEARNWLTDLDCRRALWKMADGSWLPGLKVHEGFQNALGAVWGRLKVSIDRMMVGRTRLWLTGHSLGGALAMLAAGRWQAGAGRAVAPWVYTFGQPRVGNAAWSRWYDARLKDQTFRIIHADDVVPRAPWLLATYRHAGTEVFYPSYDSHHAPSSYLIDLPWWRKAGSDLSGLTQEWREGKIALLADHRLETYLRLFGESLHTPVVGPRTISPLSLTTHHDA